MEAGIACIAITYVEFDAIREFQHEGVGMAKCGKTRQTLWHDHSVPRIEIQDSVKSRLRLRKTRYLRPGKRQWATLERRRPKQSQNKATGVNHFMVNGIGLKRQKRSHGVYPTLFQSFTAILTPFLGKLLPATVSSILPIRA